MRQFGIDVGDTRLDVSFGVGEHNWKNYEASELQAQLRPEIAAFGRVLWWVSKLEFITIFVSIDFLLRVLRFSAAFRFRMVYPLVALFFGTGNQTPKVSAAVIARVFLDQNLAIFEYDAQRLLAQTPTNIAFDDLQGFYGKMRAAIESAHCRFRFGTRVTRIERPGNSNNKNGPVRVHVAKADAVWRGGSDQLDGQYPIAGGGPRCQPEHAEAEKKRAAASDLLYTADEMEEVIEVDELILATPANVSLSLLGERELFREERPLPSVEYYHDLTVTHTDAEYMRSHNKVDGKAIYFIRTHPRRPSVWRWDLSSRSTSRDYASTSKAAVSPSIRRSTSTRSGRRYGRLISSTRVRCWTERGGRPSRTHTTTFATSCRGCGRCRATRTRGTPARGCCSTRTTLRSPPALRPPRGSAPNIRLATTSSRRRRTTRC